MTDFALRLIALGGYWGIAFLMCLENVVPPVPSELIMGLGGIAVARGNMGFVPLLLAGTAGTLIGNFFWYELGRKLGHQRLKPLISRYGRWVTLDWHEVEKMERMFDKYGGSIVFVARMLPTFRTMISLPAGMMCMPRWRFAIWTSAGAAIWNAVLIGAGWYLGRRFAELDKIIGPVAIGIVVLVVLWFGWRLLTWRPNGVDA